MAHPFDISSDRYQPDFNYTYAATPSLRVDQRTLSFFVGLVAFGLPFVMILGTALGACAYDSISHYYYAQFWGDIFVGALVFVGTFMIVYRGANASESFLATLTGIATYCVALFPTSGRGCPLETFSGRALADFERFHNADFVTVTPASKANSLFELFPGASTLHFIAAAALFALLAFHAFFVFTREAKDQREPDGTLKPAKRTRNRIYIVCGTLIVISMAAIGFKGAFDDPRWDQLNLTFWFEALALWAFGFSWMVKGRFFFGTAMADDRDLQDIQAISPSPQDRPAKSR